MYSYNNSISLLVDKFSDMKEIYEENLYDYEDLPYIFYESEFVKYIMDKYKINDEIILCEIFEFIEDMLLNGDEEIVNLIGVTILESLCYEKDFSKFDKFSARFHGDLTKNTFSMLKKSIFKTL